MFIFNERLLLFLTIEASFLSAAAVGSIILFIIYKFLRRTVLAWGKSGIQNVDATDSILFLNLMFADLIQAVGNMPSIRWMENGFITEDALCTAQGAIKQVGIVGVAMTSLAIGVQTFSILVLRWHPPKHVSKFMAIGVWVFAAIVIGIPNIVHRSVKYYGISGYWCWIIESPQFKAELVVTEYLWVWVSGFTMMILYGIMFVVMRGWVVIDEGVHWHKNYKPKHPDLAVLETEEEKRSKEIANLMLFYPAVYIVCFLPNSLSRWLFFSIHTQHYQFTLLASTLFALSGLFNVILFFSTRPDLVKGGPNIVVESEELALQSRKGISPRVPNDARFGGLPERNYGLNGDRSSPTTESWPVHGRRDSESLEPSMLSDHGLYTASPTSAFNGSLALPTHARNNSYRSGEHTKKFMRESASLMEEEEEDYGRLPDA